MAKRIRNNSDNANINSNDKRKFILLVSLIVVVVIVLLLIIFRGSLGSLFGKKDEVIVNSGTLFQDNFPIEVNSNIEYQMDKMDKELIMLSDTHIYIYSADGELLDTRQHDYSNSILKTSGKRALVYESGGKNFKVESKRKTVYTKSMDNNIVFARINDKGYVAVVTVAEMYACELHVFDENGNEVYYRGCVDRIEDLCFNSNNTGCVAVTVSASGGQIVSKVMYLHFDDTNSDWTSESLETLCLGVEINSKDEIFLLGDTKCAYYDGTGTQLEAFSYKNQLISGSIDDGKCAMLFKNEERRKTTLLLINDYNSTPIEMLVDSNIKKVYTEDSKVYILKNDVLETYDYSGKLLATADVLDIYKDFIKLDNTMLLRSYDKIDKIDYIS